MEGRSHLLVGLTAAVVLDSVVHITGTPLMMTSTVSVTLLVKKIVFYSMVALGSLLALGLEQLVVYLLAMRGLTIPALFIRGEHLVFISVLFGCIMHIAADA